MSHYSSEPKTIEDYKDVVKILKLKIIKQNRKIQQLQQKVISYESQIQPVTSVKQITPNSQPNLNQPLTDFDTSTLKGKAAVMYLFLQGTKKLGVTPQSIYRIADFSYKNQVESDYFRSVLSKINLGLTPKQISCLIFIFDQTCSGFIYKDDYLHSLHAYQIGLQDSNLPYNQQCLLKVATLLHNEKINLTKLYEQMEGKAKKRQKNNKSLVDANVYEEQIKKMYGKKILEREIIGSFNEIDLQSQGYLEKTNFLYCLTSFINRILLGQQIPPKKTAITGFGDHGTPNSNNKTLNNIIDSVINLPSNIRNQQSQSSVIDTFFTNYKITMNQIYEEIMRLPFENRITLRQFKNALLKLNTQIQKSLLTGLFKQIDSNNKGSIYIDQLIRYWLLKNKDSDIIFKLMGKYFYYHGMSIDSLMFTQGLQNDNDISKDKFLNMMSKQFHTGDGLQWQHIWSVFDKNAKGVVNVESITKILTKYEIV